MARHALGPSRPQRQSATARSDARTSSSPSGGEPLSDESRRFFEPRFGFNFGTVRVHTDARASQAARQLDARAFTVGNQIAFRTGAYAPQTYEGKGLLAHELAHVVQQTSGASGSGGGGPILQREVEPEPGWSISPDAEPEPKKADDGTTSLHVVSLLESFDVDRRKGRRPWKLDRLLKRIAKGFQASPGSYIEVVAFYDPQRDRKPGGEEDRARQRLQIVRQALVQMAVPAKRMQARIRFANPHESPSPLTEAVVNRQMAILFHPGSASSAAWQSGGGTPSGTAPVAETVEGGAEVESAKESPSESEVKATFEGFEGVKVHHSQGWFQVSLAGELTVSPKSKGPVKSGTSFAPWGTLTVFMEYEKWNLSASIHPDQSWEVFLTFPGRRLIPDRLLKIFGQATASMESLVEAFHPHGLPEFPPLGQTVDLVKPHVQGLKQAFRAAAAWGEYTPESAIDPDDPYEPTAEGPLKPLAPLVTGGIVVGTGTGPGGPPVAEPQNEVHARAVITVIW